MQLNNGGTDKNLDYDSFMGGAPSGGAPGGNQGYNQGGGYQGNQGNFNNQGQGVRCQNFIVDSLIVPSYEFLLRLNCI